jgi:arylsulfatase A-like enzyme
MAAAGSAAFACGGRDDLDGRRAPVPGLEERGPAWELPLGTRRADWSLYDNRASAGVYLDEALHIDCGTVDFAKYAEGAYRSPWHLGVSDGGVRAALVDGLAGELYVPIDHDAGGVYRDADGEVRIAMYVRAAAPKQLVSVFLNEHKLGDLAMPGTEWSWHGLTAPASAVRDGENKLRFYFRHAGDVGGVRTAAAFARIAVGGRRPVPGKQLTPPLIAGDVTRPGGRLAALTVDRASRLSFTARIPGAGPALVFAPAGEGGAIHVRVDGAERWSGTAGADWVPVTVELDAHAGKLARIDLVSDGPVHWGNPVLATTAAAPPARTGAAVPPADHIIVWTVSSLRADRIRDASTPTFARLAREGAAFRRFVAAAPMPGPAHVALLTGRYPQGASLPEGAVTLGSRLAAAGYTTALISGNGFVNDETGFAQGFNHYLNPMRLRRPHGGRVLWQEARKVLARNTGGRTFLYVATAEPHLPWTPSEAAFAAEYAGPPSRFDPARTAELSSQVAAGSERLTADERAWLRALYDAEVRDADDALATVLEDLVELDIADRTAIVVVGDHGEELFERGSFGHGDALFQEQLAAPLILWYPGAVEPRAVESVVDAVDVYTTVLDLAGISANPEAQGASLLPVVDPPASTAFAHLPDHGRVAIAGRYKLVVPRTGPHQLYDLVADPRERENLMGTMPTAERYLRNLFGLHAALEPAWQTRRWGTPANLAPAFAADHGL